MLSSFARAGVEQDTQGAVALDIDDVRQAIIVHIHSDSGSGVRGGGWGRGYEWAGAEKAGDAEDRTSRYIFSLWRS